MTAGKRERSEELKGRQREREAGNLRIEDRVSPRERLGQGQRE
jgi:hypothetical protein